MREVGPQYSEPESVWEGDFVILTALAIAAIGCMLVLVLSQSGWV